MDLLRRGLVIAFWLTLAGGLWLALTPLTAPPPVSGPWDKVEHAVGLYVLTVLALAAFPGAARWKIALGLVGYGGLVEALQAIPALNRSAELADLAADGLGIAMALAPTFLHVRLGPPVEPAAPLNLRSIARGDPLP